ncbi:hypothetical protein PsorP6_003917 [Peronosclerospora sorghi]|uniref:Uncharacterized protein n=1 Tax=Peronosclerospora sorghi TaxID=230839 RepID=A0ACC0VL25_9STRA|nr:hypothetical protein PsorP6_003917 [Peronosclerospora sorghi]
MLDDVDAYVIIETTRYFQQLEGFVTDATTTLETLQAVLTFHTLSKYAGALSDALVEANFVFFGRTLRGQAARAPR